MKIDGIHFESFSEIIRYQKYRAEAEKLLVSETKEQTENLRSLIPIIYFITTQNLKEIEAEKRKHQIMAAKNLLKNYHTVKFKADTSYIRPTLCSTTDNVTETNKKNKENRNRAITAAADRVLYKTVNAALDEMCAICRNDNDHKFRRYYSLLYATYVLQWDITDISAKYIISKQEYHRNIKSAIAVFASIISPATPPELIL